MSRHVQCRIDPKVASEMSKRRSLNELLRVGIVLRENLRPTPPWTDAAIRRFDRLVEDILDRVEEAIGPHPHGNHLGAWVDPERGGFQLSAHISFLDELVKQPEVAECIDDLDFIDLPEPDPKSLA